MSGTEKESKKNDAEHGLLAEDVKGHFCKYVSLMILVGLVNNVGYVLVGTTAKQLSKQFNQASFLGAFQFCLIIFNGIFRLINSRFLIKIIHTKRIIVNVCVMVVGYLLIAVSCLIPTEYIAGFVLSLIASVIHGLTQCFGESTILGYLKGFPADLVVGWGSGTGFAGVVGAGLVVLLLAFQIQIFAIYLASIAFVILYLLSFIYLNRQKNKFAKEDGQQALMEAGEENNGEVDEAKGNIQMGFGTFWKVFSTIWWLCGSESTVYYFEYTIFTSFAERAIAKLGFDEQPDFLHKHAFEIFLFCYQVGVVISRSSLKVVKVGQVWAFFIMQGIAYAFWLTEIILLYRYNTVMLDNIYAMIVIIFLVGIIGGGCYVNTMYCIISHKKLEFSEKELALNICTILDDCGIIGASITAIVMSNWVFPT